MDTNRNIPVLHDPFNAQHSSYSSNSHTKEFSPESQHQSSRNYGNLPSREANDYENAPYPYSRQNSDVRKSPSESNSNAENNDSSSSNDRMVFAQQTFCLTSQAKHKAVSKVEPPSSSKARSQSESTAAQSYASRTDTVNISKQATVKDIRSNSTSAERRPSYSNAMNDSLSDTDSDQPPIFVMPVMRRPSSKDFLRQRFQEHEPSTSGSKSVSPDPKKSKSPEPSLESPSAEVGVRIGESRASVTTLRLTITNQLSSDSQSDDAKHSSHSSSLASLSNVVAPCGSTEDLDNSDSEVFSTKASKPNQSLHTYNGSTTEQESATAPTTDLNTSDFVRDITSTLDEALSSMHEVMSRKDPVDLVGQENVPIKVTSEADCDPTADFMSAPCLSYTAEPCQPSSVTTTDFKDRSSVASTAAEGSAAFSDVKFTIDGDDDDRLSTVEDDYDQNYNDGDGDDDSSLQVLEPLDSCFLSLSNPCDSC
mgnify:CR=1 FL=1